MKLHYFQRYNQKENVATANTMLLLNRLYSYSPRLFFDVLQSEEAFGSIFDPEVSFELQVKGAKSVADAVISQPSFKIVVETKIEDWFYNDQLTRHLDLFVEDNHEHNLLLTIAASPMAREKKDLFESTLRKFREDNPSISPVVHRNTTFEKLSDAVREVLDDTRDYEMLDVLEDYLDFCIDSNLIVGADSWRYMRSQLAGDTFDFNLSEGVYYDRADRPYRAHDYLGLYKQKSVRAIGKVCARINAVYENGVIKYEELSGELTEERKKKIDLAIADGDSHGYDLRSTKHTYFFVEKFFETDFKKTSPRAPMGSRVFDIASVLQFSNASCPSTDKIANELKQRTWA